MALEQSIKAATASRPAIDLAADSVFAVFAVASVLALGHAYTAGAFSAAAMVALLAILGVSLALGVALSLTLRLDDDGQLDFIGVALLGMVALSTGLLFLGVLVPWSVSGNLLIMAVAGGAGVYLHRGRWQEAVGATPAQPLIRLRLGQDGLFALAVILIASVGWSLENLRGMSPVAPGVFESHPWVDIFGHSTNVSRFMNPRGAPSLGNEQFAGLPLAPYHYAAYMLTAFVGRVGNLQAYALTASILPMLGMIWMGMAAYLIGRACAGARAGAVAALGLMMLPDTPGWGLGHTWTSYFFFQQVGMGGAYAVAVMGLAVVLGVRSAQVRSWRPLFGAGVLIGVAALYKIQVVLAFGLPLAILLVALHTPWAPRVRLGVAVLLVILYGLALAVAAAVPHAPTLGFTTEFARMNVSMILGLYPKFLSSPLRPLLGEDASYARVVVIGICVILVKIYGAWLVILAAGAVLSRRVHARARAYRGFLLALALLAIVTHLIAALCVGPNLSGRGDLYEVIHKAFVWPYFVVAVCSSTLLGMYLAQRMRTWPRSWGAAAAALALVAGTGLVMVLGQNTQTRVTSASPLRVQLHADYLAATEYLRTQTSPDAVVQYYENDPVKMFAALTERKSFVIMCDVNCGTNVPLAERRFAQLEAALEQPDVNAMRAALRSLGIDWLVIARDKRAWQGRPGAVADAKFGTLELYSTMTRSAARP